MPWTSQGGGGGGWQGGGGQGGGGRGPWGSGPSGPSGVPDLEEFLRRGQDRMRRWFPGGKGGSRGLIILILVAFAIWMASGFYRVQPDEQGVVLRFGEWVETTQPGLNYHLPAPIEAVIKPKVTKVNRAEVGFRTSEDPRVTGTRSIPGESLMLTGDENIVDVHFAVFWVIKDAGQFLFEIRNPEETVKAVSESAMREIVGKTDIATALAEGRAEIEAQSLVLIQGVLDNYESGIQVTQVELQKVDPPEAVIDAFRDVQRAKADEQRAINEAESYKRDILPRARGLGEKVIQEADGYRQEVIARAEGDANRFLAVHTEYKEAKDVTRKRIYLETMEELFAGMNKVIIDSSAQSSQGVVPYLPLPALERARGQQENQ